MRSLKVVLLVCALSCSSSTAVEIGGVVASTRMGTITITNLTAKPVYTFVLGRNFSALANWIPCRDPERCDALAAGASKLVPYPSDAIPEEETEAIVNWWHLVPDPAGGFKPDSIRVGVAPIQ